jgi:orotidine-5'-phosphate decarboxylase
MEVKMSHFIDLLQKHWQEHKFLCVGLDTDYDQLPAPLKQASITDALFQFNQAIVDATGKYCCAFKPNIAFYEGYGPAGLEALMRTNRYIRNTFPGIPIILDAKRADIGNTNYGYVKAVKEVYDADAITVHPYLGKEALKPFLDEADLGVIVLCHTSNPGAAEFQELAVKEIDLYKKVAYNVYKTWNYNHNCALVVGATYPAQIGEVRAIAPELPLLIPGIGAQGGDLEKTVRQGLDHNQGGMIINVSRSIIYASRDVDFARAAEAEAAKIDRAIKEYLPQNK